MSTWRHFPRETTESIGVPLVDEATNPATAITVFEAQVVVEDQRPADDGWVAVTLDDNDIPTIAVTNHDTGGYDVYIRLPDGTIRLFDRFYLD
jgi:hypothetical protein